ncbi:MAG: hypothetical protein ACRC92_20340 [Peptostreptococcaceae bacterium]
MEKRQEFEEKLLSAIQETYSENEEIVKEDGMYVLSKDEMHCKEYKLLYDYDVNMLYWLEDDEIFQKEECTEDRLFKIFDDELLWRFV